MAMLVDPLLSESVSKLLEIVVFVAKTTANFKSQLEQLKITLQRIGPIIDEIRELNRKLDRSKQESDMFVDEIQDARKLVHKCLKIKRNLFKRFTHSLKLKDLNEKLLRFFQIEVQADQSRDLKRTLVEVNRVSDRIETMALDMKNLGQTLSNNSSMTMSLRRVEDETIEREKLGWRVPTLPRGIVAFEKPLEKLKAMVLADKMDCDDGFDDGSVVVVSAPGGCGKTTLVTMLCYDAEIQAKFGERIFFVTVSETPNFMVFVNDLLNPNSFAQQVRFQNSTEDANQNSIEDAKNKLENFLREKVSGPLLLVLDDVWSDSFIKNFTFNITGYKILVTSRMVFLNRDMFQFDPLTDEDAKTLFQRSAFPEERRPTHTIHEDLVNQAWQQQQLPKAMLPAIPKKAEPSFLVPDQICQRFSLDQILSATQNFDEALVVGRGGFSKVYKGLIKDGSNTVVAIKRLNSMSNQGALELQAEVEMLSKIRHCNLVSLIGYCNEGTKMALVYEYMPEGTLADHLHKAGARLSWLQLLKICIGAARGLDYLHTGTGTQHGIIHRDVKSSNILLDNNFAAKISDFGLAKISPINQTCTHVSTVVKGTFGYMDPRYVYTGELTRKSDVYSFGVLLLEVICGRPAVDTSLDEDEWGLAPWAQDRIREGKRNLIIDSRLREQISKDSSKGFVRIASQCLHNQPNQRPTMAEIVARLEVILSLQKRLDSSITEGKSIGKVWSFF